MWRNVEGMTKEAGHLQESFGVRDKDHFVGRRELSTRNRSVIPKIRWSCIKSAKSRDLFHHPALYWQQARSMVRLGQVPTVALPTLTLAVTR